MGAHGCPRSLKLFIRRLPPPWPRARVLSAASPRRERQSLSGPAQLRSLLKNLGWVPQGDLPAVAPARPASGDCPKGLDAPALRDMSEKPLGASAGFVRQRPLRLSGLCPKIARGRLWGLSGTPPLRSLSENALGVPSGICPKTALGRTCWVCPKPPTGDPTRRFVRRNPRDLIAFRLRKSPYYVLKFSHL